MDLLERIEEFSKEKRGKVKETLRNHRSFHQIAGVSQRTFNI